MLTTDIDNIFLMITSKGVQVLIGYREK